MALAPAPVVKRIAWWFAVLAGCSATSGSAPEAEPIVVTDMASYTAACEEALGELPAFDCAEATELEITVTDPVSGIRTVVDELSDLEDGSNCDRPFYIGGCTPHTRIGQTTNSRGSTFVFICRAYEFRTQVLFDDLGLIGHDPVSGASCFWAVPIDGTTFDGSSIPRPGSAEDLTFFDDRPFWYTLDGLAQSTCMRCHDNDPYIHDPIIESAGIVPRHPLAPYRAVAEEALNERGSTQLWSPARKLVHPDAGMCTNCHRLSDRFTCELARDATGEKITATGQRFSEWPRSHWMDAFDAEVLTVTYPSLADWETTYGLAAQTVRDCCADPASTTCWAPME